MRVVLILVCSLLGVPLQGGAQSTPAAPTTENCQLCHADSGATRANGASIAVSPDAFGTSIHGVLSCVDCHQDLATTTEWPHPDTLQKVSCATCHDDAARTHANSVHQNVPEGMKGAQCIDCHGTHDILPSSDPASRTYALNLPTTCARCHSGTHLRGIAGQAAGDYGDSVHGRALTRSGLVVSANCSSCHGAHDIRGKLDPESRVHRANIATTCATCHEGVQTLYARSVHGQQIADGKTGAAVCSDCHASHRVQRTDSEAWRLAVIDECGTCHVERMATYRDTYHGKVTALGFTRVAECSSCHGSHTIQPASNPASMVAPGNLVTTCRQCHENASENFVKYDPHADKHDPERSPLLYWANRFMQALLVGVFLFFGTHTLLWFPRSYAARKEQDAARRQGKGAGR